MFFHANTIKKCQTMTYMRNTILSCQTTFKNAKFLEFGIKNAHLATLALSYARQLPLFCLLRLISARSALALISLSRQNKGSCFG